MKKTRKDIFRKAIADNLNQKAEEASELGDFVSDMKKARSPDGAVAGEPAEGAPNENGEGKKGLPEQKEEKKNYGSYGKSFEETHRGAEPTGCLRR